MRVSPLSALSAAVRVGLHPTTSLWGPKAVKDMTQDDLKDHLKLLEDATADDLDELLHDLLVRVYPTKKTQDS